MGDNPVSANYVMGKSIYESGQARKEEFCNSRAWLQPFHNLDRIYR